MKKIYLMVLAGIAKKEVLTDEDKGFVIGSFCRLEAIAVGTGTGFP